MAESILNELKEILSKHLLPNGVDVSKLSAQDTLFSQEGLSLDSIDAVELLSVLQQKYGVTFSNIHENRAIFQTLGSLAKYVEENRTK